MRNLAKLLLLICLMLGAKESRAHSSYLDFISMMNSSKAASFCLETGNVEFSGVAAMTQTCMPDTLEKASECPGPTVGEMLTQSILTMLTGGNALFGQILGFPGLVYQMLSMLDICANSFVLPYYEEVMFSKVNGGSKAGSYQVVGGSHPIYKGNQISGQTKTYDVYSSTDIPHRFQCSEPTGRGYDYKLCSHYSRYQVGKGALDQVVAVFKPAANLMGSSAYNDGSGNLKNPMDASTLTFDIQECKASNCSKPFLASLTALTYFFQPYYSFSGNTVQLCIGTLNSLLPIKIGCVGVASPMYTSNVPQELVHYIDQTRCQYLLSPRHDLQSLGAALDDARGDSSYTTSLAKFLKSDFHFASTIVGCIKDLLKGEVVPSADEANATSFLQRVQAAMQQIATAALVLYLCLTGVKIISSPRPPSGGELISMLLKFALVSYFALGSVWYNINGTRQNPDGGLYTMLMDVSEDVGNIFLGALGSLDPLQRCEYLASIDGKIVLANLLSNQLLGANKESIKLSDVIANNSKTLDSKASGCIPAAGESIYNNYSCNDNKASGLPGGTGCVYQTAGFSGPNGTCAVKTTIWDMVDCRIANYINFGTCQYDIGGFILLWIFSPTLIAYVTGIATGSITSAVSALIFGIAGTIYMFLLFIIVIRYIHIFIISFFILTVLTIMAPLFIVFSLFKQTEQMFKSWAGMMLGYMVYPGLLFAYFALIFATLDSIYYGYAQVMPHSSSSGSMSEAINKSCAEGDPYNLPYCFIQNVSYFGDPCSGKIDVFNLITTKINLGFVTLPIFTYPDGAIAGMLIMILKLMLFAILFYHFAKKIEPILQNISGIQGLGFGHLARGSFNIMNAPSIGVGSGISAIKGLNKQGGKDGKSGVERLQDKAKNVSGVGGSMARGSLKAASGVGSAISKANDIANK